MKRACEADRTIHSGIIYSLSLEITPNWYCHLQIKTDIDGVPAKWVQSRQNFIDVDLLVVEFWFNNTKLIKVDIFQIVIVCYISS